MKNKCIICGSENLKIEKAEFCPFLTERMFGNQKKEISCIICENCEIKYSNYRPSAEQMSNLYTGYRDDGYQEQRQKHEQCYTKELNYLIGNDVQDMIVRKKLVNTLLDNFTDTSQIKNVLDYGGDQGQFIPDELNSANRYVYEISDIKPIEGIKSITNKNELKNHNWDFIMCCHVLEHVPYPMEITEELKDLLHKGSYLYVEVPYECWTISLYKRIKLEICETIKRLLRLTKTKKKVPPVYVHEHINSFRPKTFQKIFADKDFKICHNKVLKRNCPLGKVKVIACLVQKIR